MSLMHDVVFCNFFLQKFLSSRTNMMDLLHFMSLFLDVLFIQCYGLGLKISSTNEIIYLLRLGFLS